MMTVFVWTIIVMEIISVIGKICLIGQTVTFDKEDAIFQLIVSGFAIAGLAYFLL